MLWLEEEERESSKGLRGLKGGAQRALVGVIKKHRVSSSSSSNATNRNVDVSNSICLTACVFGFKKSEGVEGERSLPAGGSWGGGAASTNF